MNEMGVCASNKDKPNVPVTLTPAECKDLRGSLQEFIPILVDTTCISVYDGDSIRVQGRICMDGIGNSPPYQFVIRLLGIDTPEMRSRDPYEKRAARIAKRALSDAILGQPIRLEISGKGKYGRLLARVYYAGECMNTALVTHKLASIYDGGTKDKHDYKQKLLLIDENVSLL